MALTALQRTQRQRPARRRGFALAVAAAAGAAALAARSQALSWVSSRLPTLALGAGCSGEPSRGRTPLRASWLELLEEQVGLPKPSAANPPIPAQPLDAALVRGDLHAYTLEEKAMSMGGEDFDVKDPDTGEVILKIGGGNRIPIPGMPVWDKLTISTPSGGNIGFLDRQVMALTTSYDLQRADGSKFARINKALMALTPTFELWQEGDGQPGPLLRAEGSFSEKSYVMKCHNGNVVATVARLSGFSGGNVDTYTVVVGPQVDASLVLAMAVVIDEVHDEENKDNEGGEGLPDMLEDAQGLPMPVASSPPIPSPMAPLDAALVHGQTTAYELEEKALSMTGEDFEVKSPQGELVLKINGGNRLPIGGLPVWDKLDVTTAAGTKVATLDREMISMTPTYDVYRPDGAKFGKINKGMFGLSEFFEFYVEGQGSPVLKAEGTFTERKYTFKNPSGAVVAAVGRGYYQTDNENKYHCVVGPQVDATMVLAMAVVIDEVHDEENQKEKQEGGGGGFPFR